MTEDNHKHIIYLNIKLTGCQLVMNNVRLKSKLSLKILIFIRKFFVAIAKSLSAHLHWLEFYFARITRVKHSGW